MSEIMKEDLQTKTKDTEIKSSASDQAEKEVICDMQQEIVNFSFC
jgi:hypothetical protein